MDIDICRGTGKKSLALKREKRLKSYSHDQIINLIGSLVPLKIL